jgi:hypothetical protein
MMVVKHAYNPATQEAEISWIAIQDQPRHTGLAYRHMAYMRIMVQEKHKGQETWLKCLPSKQGPEFKSTTVKKKRRKAKDKIRLAIITM